MTGISMRLAKLEKRLLKKAGTSPDAIIICSFAGGDAEPDPGFAWLIGMPRGANEVVRDDEETAEDFLARVEAITDQKGRKYNDTNEVL